MTHEDLVAESCVRALVARYCHAIASRDHDAWADTFASDAEWTVLGRTARGREDVLALYLQLVSGCRWAVQRATDGLIEVNGDTATGRWIITEYIQLASGASLMNLGTYQDDYRRCEGGRWRFARRVFAPIYVGPTDLSARPARL